MASILTNTGAMIALQSLRSTNSRMDSLQTELSTGKSVATSKQDPAIWAISKVMTSDVRSFEAISHSLNLGHSTLAVARNAAESITELMKSAKAKVVAAQEGNVDRKKLQTELKALFAQVTSVTNAAQFNGLNLLDGSKTDDFTILAALNRSGEVDISTTKINVPPKSVVGAELAGYSIAEVSALGGVNASHSSASLSFDDGSGGVGATATERTANSDATNIIAGDRAVVTVDGSSFSYTIKVGDDHTAIGNALNNQIKAAGLVHVSAAGSGGGGITLTNANTSTPAKLAFQVKRGGVGELDGINLTTDTGAKAALGSIEDMIQRSIDMATHFGSAQKRVHIQSSFVSQLTKALKSGIGALVDANMEDVSARLQALQVQQQLGTQALSIANKAPQSLLSLFK